MNPQHVPPTAASSTSATLVRIFHEMRAAEHDLRAWLDTAIPADVHASIVTRLLAQLHASPPGERGHGHRVARLTAMIARTLGWAVKDVDDLAVAAELHDLGKVGVDPAILNKPDTLSDPEAGVVSLHTSLGAQLLGSVRTPLLSLVRDVALSHHERWDGTGYPDQLRAMDIPIAARIVAVADVFDALTSDRPYREAFSPTAALRIVAGGRGSQFDPTITDAFLSEAVNGDNVLPAALAF